MAALSAYSGQVTGLFGRGSGIPPGEEEAAVGALADPPELHAARSELAPPTANPATALCLRKPRRDISSPRLSSVHPSCGCIPGHPFLPAGRHWLATCQITGSLAPTWRQDVAGNGRTSATVPRRGRGHRSSRSA